MVDFPLSVWSVLAIDSAGNRFAWQTGCLC
jgi:hypothetical protein